jgi:hypothetical protein
MLSIVSYVAVTVSYTSNVSLTDQPTPYNHTKLPIVYVYTVVQAVCSYGLADYIKVSLEQALLTQPDCDIVIASNFGDCPTLAPVVQQIPNVILVDTIAIESQRTKKFATLAKDIFQSDRFGELWITSALRFFIMEDIMNAMHYTELFHVEGDNLLYGRLTSLLTVLREGYKGLAATPLTANKSFITASVFWIANLQALQRFNSFLYALASNKSSFQMYLNWLRPFGCCKRGGVDPDQHGNGIKPFAINEMSMLAFYHKLHPYDFLLLPVVPHQTFILNRWVCNMSDFGPGGRAVGPETNDGIWDPNSWGQYIGGTSHRHGKDRGFRDGSHIIGQAIGTTRCRIAMACSLQSNEDIAYENGRTPYYVVNRWVHKCITAPYIQCEGGPYTRLWNLHVHSKNTHKFMSTACDCATAHSLEHVKWVQLS